MSDIFEDKTVPCRDCKVDFVYTVGEQRFFAEKGFTSPTRCKACREARKADKGGATSAPQAQVTSGAPRPKYNSPEIIVRSGGYSAPPPPKEAFIPPPKAAGRKPNKGRRTREDYDNWDRD